MARISGFDVHTAVAPLGGLGERAWRPVNRRRNACRLPLRQPSGFEVRTGDLRRVVAFTPVNTGYFACSPPFPHSGSDLHGIPVLFSPRQQKRRRENQRDKPVAHGPCGSRPRRPPAVLPPPPVPFAPDPPSRNPHPPGGTPLSEGGECLRALLAPNAALTSCPRRPRPPNSPKNRKNGLRASPVPSFGMTDSGGQGLPALPIPAQGESSGFRLTTPSGKNGVSFMRGRMGGERGKTSGFFVFSKEVAGGGISSGFPGNHGRGAGMVDGRGVRGGRGIFRCSRGSRWGGRCGGGCGGGSICSGRR